MKTSESAKFVPLVFMPKQDEDAFEPVALSTAPIEILNMPDYTVQEKSRKAIEVLKWAMQQWSICYSYSGGKDSTTVLSLALAAAAELKMSGGEVKPFLVLNSNTLVENPEVLNVVDSEISKIRAYIARHQLPGEVLVTEPYLLSQWAVFIIGGRTIISTPATNRNCTTSLKSDGLSRAKKQYFGKNRISKGRITVGVTGVRFSESAERAGNMKKRAESPIQIVQTNKDEDVFLAPIANWSTDDVMEFIGLALNHDALPEEDQLPLDLYSDCAEVFRIYKDAEGECSIGLADNKPSSGCSARHGCYVCTMVSNDKSMNAMLTQERYTYMTPLAKYREYLTNTVFDLSKRTWIGRSITNGHIAFGPDAYSPEYLQDILRYALTIDRDEKNAARKLGIRPRFEIVSKRALIAIDAQWSMQAFTLPFAAMKIYHDVYRKGMSFEVPTTKPVAKTPLPATRYIPVEDWDEDARDDFGGLRNALLEATEGPCAATSQVTSKNKPARTIMSVETGRMFDVHEESAELIFMYELDSLVSRYEAAAENLKKHGYGMVGEAYKYYVSLGAITIASAKVGEVDSILRRSSWRERNGLAGYNYNHEKALAMSLEKPLPVAQRQQAPEPTKAEIEQANRAYDRAATRSRRIPLNVLFREWAPNVPWHRLHKQGLPTWRLLAHCLQKQVPAYNIGRRKGWAIHHFVYLGELVQFLKDNPLIAQQVKAFRAKKKTPVIGLIEAAPAPERREEKFVQLDLFAA